MADQAEPTEEQVRVSVRDAIRKLTEPAADGAEDEATSEGRGDAVVPDAKPTDPDHP